MGIKDFFKYVRDNHPELMVGCSYETLAYRRVAIDMMNVLYTCKARSKRNWVHDVLSFIHTLRQHYIHPVCVFDGRTHPLKTTTTQKRRDTKAKYYERVLALERSLNHYVDTHEVDVDLHAFLSWHVHARSALTGKPKVEVIRDHIAKQLDQYSLRFSPREVDQVKHLIELMGVSVLTARFDGEALCAALNREGAVDCVLSNDSDVFMFGAQTVLCKFNTNGGYMIQRGPLLEALGLDEEEFFKVCIVSGTDFNENLKGVRFTTAVRHQAKRNTLSSTVLEDMRAAIDEITDTSGYTLSYSSRQMDERMDRTCLTANLQPFSETEYPVSELVFE
jgi:5'-3' exonuclease